VRPAKDEDVRELAFLRACILLGLTSQFDVVFHAVGRRWRSFLQRWWVCLCAVPNFFSRSDRQGLAGMGAAAAGARPRSAGAAPICCLRSTPTTSKKEEARPDTRWTSAGTLRDAKIGYTGLAVRNEAVEVRIRQGQPMGPNAVAKLRELSQPLGGLLGSSGQRSVEVSDAGGGLIRITVPQAAITERIRQNHRTIDSDRRAPRQPARHR